MVGERPCENKKEKKERSSERFYINNITSLEQIKIPGNNPQMKYANVLLLPQRRIQSFLRPWLELLHQGTGLDIPSYLYKQVKGLQFTSKRGYVTWAQLFEGRLALNPGAKFNPSFTLLCSKAFSRIIFCAIFRASNLQLVDKKN